MMYVKKSDSSEYDTFEVEEVFRTAKTLEEMKSYVENAKERLYTTWETVDIADNANERIPIEDVIAQKEAYMRKGGLIMDNHSNKKVGNTIAYRIMSHPKNNKLGILLLNRIDNINELDDKVWKETVSGERTGSSVGGYNIGESFEMSEDGKMVKSLQNFRHTETSNVLSPCNPLALNEAISAVAKGEHVYTSEDFENAMNVIKAYKAQDVKKPMGEYNDFDACVSANQDKKNPEAYCGEIKQKVEGDTKKQEDETDTDIDDNVVKSEVNVLNKNVEKSIMQNPDEEKTMSEATKQIESADIKKAEMKEEDKEVVSEEETKDTEKNADGSDPTKDAPIPELPEPTDSNDMDAVGKRLSSIEKSLSQVTNVLDKVVARSSAPAQPAEVKKVGTNNTNLFAQATDVAKGNITMNFRQAHNLLNKEIAQRRAIARGL